MRDNYIKELNIEENIRLKNILLKDIDNFCQKLVFMLLMIQPTIINRQDLKYPIPLQKTLLEIEAKFYNKLIKNVSEKLTKKNKKEELNEHMKVIEREIKIKNMDICNRIHLHQGMLLVKYTELKKKWNPLIA